MKFAQLDSIFYDGGKVVGKSEIMKYWSESEFVLSYLSYLCKSISSTDEWKGGGQMSDELRKIT